MTTRDLVRWHWSARDLVQLAGAALVVLELAASRLERVIDDAGG